MPAGKKKFIRVAPVGWSRNYISPMNPRRCHFEICPGNSHFFKIFADNRLTNRWSAAKTNTVYKYDAVGSLTNVVYAVSPPINLKYDALNRLTNLVDAVGTTVYGYDAAGPLLSAGGPGP